MKSLIRRGRDCTMPERNSFAEYAVLYAAAETAAFYIYVHYAATIRVSGKLFWILVLLSVSIGYFGLTCSWKYGRNLFGLLSAVILPFLYYEAVAFYKYFPDLHGFLFAAVVIAAAVSGACAVLLPHKPRRKSLRRKAVRGRFLKTVYTLVFLILLVFCLYGKHAVSVHQIVQYTAFSSAEQTDSSTAEDYEYTLPLQIAAVAKLDPAGGWDSLSLEEITEVLETIIRISCNSLGMKDSAPALQIAYLEQGLLGQYCRGTDTITLSYNYIIDSRAGGYSVAEVLCHELYHRYEHYLVDLLQTVKDSKELERYSGLLLLSDAYIYEEEIENYVTADGSAESYYRYANQRLELDAEDYGNSCMSEYYEAVQDYLEINSRS